jgi:hypothetical protein
MGGRTRPLAGGQVGVEPAAPAATAAATAAPVEVAAYYYPNYHHDARNQTWYGPGWTEWELVKAAQPRFDGHQQPVTPAWGHFDEASPAWAERQVALAAEHGITAFLFDWYWYDGQPYLEGALERGFLGAPSRSRLKFALMWANHDWRNIQPAHAGRQPHLLARGALSAAEFDQLTDYVVARYLMQPNYLTLDGRPYFSIYELSTFVKGIGSADDARRALARFREKARAAGRDGLHLNGVVWGASGGAAPALGAAGAAPLPSSVAEAAALGLDSVTSYTWYHHYDTAGDQFPHGSYRTAIESYGAWCERCRRFPLDYHPNVTMGWDPSPRTVASDGYEPRGYPWTSILHGNTPEAFELGLRQVRALLDRPQPSGVQQRLVTLNAWNEWTEGSYLLPDTRHGTAYLEAVRTIFGA